jgi:KipI family sensor histidine kinase inhibitor
MTLCDPDKSGIYTEPRVLLCGETGISVEFGDRIDLEISRRVLRLYKRVREARHPGIIDLNPAYCSLFIRYDPWICSFETLLSIVERELEAHDEQDPNSGHVIEVPVCYEGEFGLDIKEVADFHGISIRKVIEIHSTPVYHVYMIGFILGFPYLGGLNEGLYTPRRKDPREKVPAGSVGIADRQTGIYPVESPGGWQIIGMTSLKLFDPERSDPFLFEPGDKIRFISISREEFECSRSSPGKLVFSQE